MDVTFKYKGKVITTPNLEKKLKRMRITVDDIEIIPTVIRKKEENGIEDYMLGKEQVIVCSTEDDIKRVCWVKKPYPTIYELFKNQIYNSTTKTGLYTEEFIKTMYYV